MNIKTIKEIIPHRYPFLLVDSILELKKNEKCVTLKNVSANEEFFQGHFPEDPIMPGVLIVEALAQTSALIGEKEKDQLFMIVGIENFRFLQQVVPGDQLICTAKVKRTLMNMFLLDVEAQVKKPDGEIKICATGVLKCAKVKM